MKNPFGTLGVYLQVLLTRLTLVIKTWLFLKPTNVDKNRLAALHTKWQRKLFSHLRNARGCGWPWFIFCHYQQTVVANGLLLNGNQFITIFLTLGLKPTIVIANHNWSHSISIVSIMPRCAKVLSLRPQQKYFLFAGSVVGPDSPWSFWSTGFLWRNLPETFLSSFSSIHTSKNLLETFARWNNRWDQGKLTEGEASVRLTSSFG